MALIKCPDCGKDISDLAPSCHNCGRPRELADATIELTSKKLKLQKVFAYMIIFLSLFVAYSRSGEYYALLIGLIGAVGGFFWLMATKIRIWWHHE